MENWKDIVGYEGCYQVSDLGRIKSLARSIDHPCGVKNKAERILIPIVNTGGYSCVILSKDAIRAQMRIHRIVAIHFIPNPDNKPVVNHKDGNKSNNKVENLEWATDSENTIHSYEYGLQQRVFTKDEVLLIRSKKKQGVKIVDIAAEINAEYSLVRQVAANILYKNV